jgi:hypothetical protein
MRKRPTLKSRVAAWIAARPPGAFSVPEVFDAMATDGVISRTAYTYSLHPVLRQLAEEGLIVLVRRGAGKRNRTTIYAKKG